MGGKRHDETNYEKTKTKERILIFFAVRRRSLDSTVSFSITDNVSLKTVTRASAGNIRIVLCRLNDQGPQRTAQGIDAI